MAHGVVPRLEGLSEGIGGTKQDILSGLILPVQHSHLQAFRGTDGDVALCCSKWGNVPIFLIAPTGRSHSKPIQHGRWYHCR